MLVKNIGNAPVLICDYNGKRFAFHRGVPVEITPEIYNSIIQSGHITATEVTPVEAEKLVEKPVEEKKPKEKPIIKPKGKKR